MMHGWTDGWMEGWMDGRLPPLTTSRQSAEELRSAWRRGVARWIDAHKSNQTYSRTPPTPSLSALHPNANNPAQKGKGREGGGVYLLPTRSKRTRAEAHLGVVDLGDERERVLPGLPYVLDGQLDGRLDALADAAHQGRLVHGHEDHDGQVLPVPGEPAVVLAVLGAVVAHLGQRRVQQQSGEEQASRREDHLPAAAVPPGWSHATVQGIGDRGWGGWAKESPPHCLGIAKPGML